jgi:3',5'-cyclic AMP phosphodiesterase CpdA
MKKIIHLSDLHVGFDQCQAHLNALVTRLIFLKKPASEYVVIITGDLVEDGTQEGLFETVMVEINRLKSAGFRILICPGNHDYGTGSNGDKDLVPKFKQAFFSDPAYTFPRLDIIDKTAFIGLDTMADELNWYDQFFAEGELGKAQLSALKTLLDSAEVKGCDHRVVYMHHHPFAPRAFHGLKDSEKLGKLLTGKIHCLLFGHNHDAKIWNGYWDIPRCYDAGSSTRKDPQKPSPHRVIYLDRDARHDYDGDFH